MTILDTEAIKADPALADVLTGGLVAAAVLALAFFALAILQLIRRTFAGASPFTLFSDAFFECPPVRGLLGLGRWLLAVSALASLVVAGRAGYLAFEIYRDTTIISHFLLAWAGGLLLAAGILHWIQRQFRDWLDNGGGAIPEVNTSVCSTIPGISDSDIADAGREAFPNRSLPFWRTGLWLRRLGLWMGLAVLAGVAATLYGRHGENPLLPAAEGWCVATWDLVITYLAELAAPLHAHTWSPLVCGLVGYLTLGTYLVFIRINPKYLFLGAIPHYLLLLLCALAVLVCLAPVASASVLAGVVFVLVGLLCYRLGSDLSVARRAKRRAETREPLKARLADECGFLRELVEARSGALPALDGREIAGRIAKGAENLAEASVFATRHFGRYLRLAAVRHRPCALAMLRFLTVNRRTCFARSWSTHAALRHPQVPVWDLELFPLHPPAGYRSSNHRLELPERWNAVLSCSYCGGSGTVWVEETRTEYEMQSRTIYYSDGQSRYVTESVPVTKTYRVQKTCTTCNGTGRLEHVQAIDTMWRVERIAASFPRFRRVEITDEAEEVEYCSVPYVEAMESVAEESDSEEGDAFDLAMRATGRRLSALAGRSADAILSLTGGRYLYRSEFSVHGFHILQIRFRSLGSKVGWFFGARPEFFFPRLPFSLSMLGTVLLLPPTALLAILVWLAGVVGLWSLVGAFA